MKVLRRRDGSNLEPNHILDKHGVLKRATWIIHSINNDIPSAIRRAASIESKRRIILIPSLMMIFIYHHVIVLFILFKFRNFIHIVNNLWHTNTDVTILLNLRSASCAALFLTNHGSWICKCWRSGTPRPCYNLLYWRSLDSPRPFRYSRCPTCIEKT